MATLTPDQLEDLQGFIKDWLRHTGRTQADLRRVLRASSIRMPVLLEELLRVVTREGLAGLAQRLCDIEALWQGEDAGAPSEGWFIPSRPPCGTCAFPPRPLAGVPRRCWPAPP